MAGDYTRSDVHIRAGDHSGVLMQQGRVTLDADFNELVELLDRRLRAEVVDTLRALRRSRARPPTRS